MNRNLVNSGNNVPEFYLIERWGMGTLNIIDWCTENGNPKPAWHEQAGSVYVIFHPAALPAAQRGAEQVIIEVAPEVTPEVRRMLAVITGEMTRGKSRRNWG